MVKFLIIQTAFIGDVILATPVIEKLHQFYPDAQIDFLLRKGNESLLIKHPYVSNIIIWNKKEQKKKNLFRIIKLIKGKKYNYVINLQRFLSTGIITALSKGEIKVGFNKNPLSFLFTRKFEHKINTGKHEVERNLELIEEITDQSIVKPKLYPSDEDFNVVSEYKMKPYICIAPTSVWFTKQYPSDKWVDLIQKLEPTYSIFLIGGPGDKEACEQIIAQSKRTHVINLCGKLSLLQTTALIKNASMNYVNDSAPMHMASSMNAPVTAVFCSTIPQFGFGPLSDNSKVIETSETLPCRPCGLHGKAKCPENHFNCAYSIKTEKLLF